MIANTKSKRSSRFERQNKTAINVYKTHKPELQNKHGLYSRQSLQSQTNYKYYIIDC